MNIVNCRVEGLSLGCGATHIRNFGGLVADVGANTTTRSAWLGGAKLAIASFIDTVQCRKAYEDLKERFNIVYQSAPRRNANSGRQFFMVVYDGMKK